MSRMPWLRYVHLSYTACFRFLCHCNVLVLCCVMLRGVGVSYHITLDITSGGDFLELYTIQKKERALYHVTPW